MVERRNQPQEQEEVPPLKIILGQTGDGKSTLLNCISSIGQKQTMSQEFIANSSAESCTTENVLKPKTVWLPIIGNYGDTDVGNESHFKKFRMVLFDSPGLSDTNGMDIEYHTAIYKKQMENPASAIILCNKGMRVNATVQSELQFLYIMYGPACFQKMIYVVTHTRVGERLFKRWNKEAGNVTQTITLESKRREIQ